MFHVHRTAHCQCTPWCAAARAVHIACREAGTTRCTCALPTEKVFPAIAVSRARVTLLHPLWLVLALTHVIIVLRDRLHFAFDPAKRIGLSSDTCNAPEHGKTRAMQGPGGLPSDAWTDVFHDASSKVGAGSVRSAKLRSFLTDGLRSGTEYRVRTQYM